MKVLIIEDEPLAAKRLKSILAQVNDTVHVIQVIDSIEDSVEWLNNNSLPDLIFMDIMLADGQSFEIFEKFELNVPVIFTTAYDEFAIQAFKVNSIDYLLKPIEPTMLSLALKKFALVTPSSDLLKNTIKSLLASTGESTEPAKYKKRFLVKSGDKFIPISISNVAYFSSSDKLSFLTTTENKRFMLDYTLDELENIVDPVTFFKLNRQYLVSFTSINVVHNFFNGKLKAFISPEITDGIIVSREKAQLFKTWLNR